MFKFIVRFLVHTLIFMLVILPLMLIGAILLLFVCPMLPKEQYRLPAWLKWFDIVDSYVGRDYSVIKYICAKGWMSRYYYIAIRNPINYFAYMHLGLKWEGTEIYTKYNERDENIGDGTRPGLRHIEVTQRTHNYDKHYYEYYWIYVYPFKKDVCFRFRMGWKIKDNKNKVGSISQWCFVISPWHNYSGVIK